MGGKPADLRAREPYPGSSVLTAPGLHLAGVWQSSRPSYLTVSWGGWKK